MAIQEVNLFKQFNRLACTFGAQFNSNKATINTLARDTATGVFATAYHAIALIGLAALATSALMFYSPAVASKFKEQLTSFAYSSVPAAVANATSAMDTPSTNVFKQAATDDPQLAYAGLPQNAPAHSLVSTKKSSADLRPQQWVTNWISKRYRVAADATDMLVSAAYTTSTELKLDPLLILAVVAIESGFNPFAESAVGAQGLMQVMSKIHHEKFQSWGGIKAALNPVANIKVGSAILKEYVTRGGSVDAGLKMYVGAAAFDNDAGYGSKVLAEYQRLKDVAAGKSVPVFTTSTSAQVRAPQKVLVEAAATPRNLPSADDKPLLPEARNTATPSENVAEM